MLDGLRERVFGHSIDASYFCARTFLVKDESLCDQRQLLQQSWVTVPAEFRQAFIRDSFSHG